MNNVKKISCLFTNREMLTIGMFYLTKKPIFTILMLQIAYLIQSGGGTGPMKPDNLHLQGANSGE